MFPRFMGGVRRYLSKFSKRKNEPLAKVGELLISPRTGKTYQIVRLETYGVTLNDIHSRKTISMNMDEMRLFFKGQGKI